MTFFLQLVLTGTMVGSIYGLVAMGFVLIFKASKVFNLAQGEMLMLFAWVTYAFLVQLNLPLPVSLILTLISAVLFGLVVERFPLRPMFGQPVFAIVMVTLGLAVIIKGITAVFWGFLGTVNYPVGTLPREPVSIGGAMISQTYLYAFFSCMLLLLVFTIFFRFTKVGLRMRAVAEGHWLAQSKGININTVLAISWIISAVLSAVGGFFLGSMQGLSTNLYFIGLFAIPAALLGGFESIPGAIIGGIVLGLSESLAGGYITGISIRSVLPYLLVILVLIFRPHGLFGLKEIERV